MAFCTRCHTQYQDGEKVCFHCGNHFVIEEDPIPVPQNMEEAGQREAAGETDCPNSQQSHEASTACVTSEATFVKRPLSPDGEWSARARPTEEDDELLEVPMDASEDQEMEKQVNTHICPSCKILYEHGTNCVRCGSPLVERFPSADREDPSLPRRAQVKKEEPKSVQEQRVKEVRKESPPLEISEQPPLNGLTDRMAGKTSPPSEIRSEIPKKIPEEITKEIPKQIQRESQREIPQEILKEPLRSPRRIVGQIGSMIVLIAAVGYIFWSIYSYFKVKGPESTEAVSKEASSLPSPGSSPPTPNSNDPAASVKEPEEVKSVKTMEGSPHSGEINAGTSAPSSLSALSRPSLEETQEKESIKTLLENIRQANLKKNIDLFLSCYSSAFKDRERKKKETLETWGNFNYLSLSYDLKSHSVSGDIAHARVEWQLRFSPKSGGDPQESKAVLDVTLKKENDVWKIREVNALS